MTRRLSADDIILRKLAYLEHAQHLPPERLAMIHGREDRLPDFHFFEQPEGFKIAHDAWFDLPEGERTDLLASYRAR